MSAMQLLEMNLAAIEDLATPAVVQQVLNRLEALVAKNATLRAENQQLRDELARLKGGSGKPDIAPATPLPIDHSSEAERRTRTPRGKPRKKQHLVVTCEQPCPVDPATLPADAVRHGTTETLVQDLVLQPEVIRFVRAVWRVSRTGQTITAPLPDGYDGAFGQHIQALLLPSATGPT